MLILEPGYILEQIINIFTTNRKILFYGNYFGINTGSHFLTTN